MDPAGAGPAGRPASTEADGSYPFREEPVARAEREASKGHVRRDGPIPVGDLDLTLTEVKQLFSFLDGSIMSVFVRHRLWESWGFCSRHTWAYAAAECELRGGKPFGVSILYEDLTGRAARAVRPSLLGGRIVLRRGNGECFTCDYASFARGDPAYAGRQARVNRRQRTTALLLALRERWEPRSCPVCLGGDGPVCRPHLLSGAATVDLALPEVLSDLTTRLYAFGRSFAWRGRPASAEEQASWVEALGWFAGWDYPARVVHAAGAP
jgi:hypothetical protein